MPGPSIRILHVEDDPADAELALRALRKAGVVFEARRVETREAFLAALEGFAPDLVLSDYRLPEFDGMAALLLAQERAPDVPVIITTGSLNEETAVACMKAGAADYVLKDSLARLGSAVRSALEKQRFRLESRRAEERVRQLNRLLRTISEINQAIVRVENPAELRSEACRILVAHGGFLMAWIGFSDAASGLVVPAASAGERADYLEGLEVRFDDSPRGRGPVGAAIRTGQPVVIGDVAADPAVAPWRARMLACGFRAIAAFPLRLRGAVTGALTVYGSRAADFGSEETDLLVELAGDLSFAFDALDTREALRESEDSHRALVATSLDGVLLATPDGQILAANAAACRMFGRSEEELKRVGRAGIVDVSDPDFPRILAKRARTGAFHGEIALLRSDRTKFTAELSMVMFTDRHGQSRVNMVIRDISERQRLETQLRQVQKMEAVGRLAGGVAHDFNNLLTVIRGYGELLSESFAGDPGARESVTEIVKAAERASTLTRQLLAFSRQQVLEARVLDVGSVVADIEKMLRRLIGEDIEVILVKPPTVGRVKADPGQIEQVILNLAVNARDAMPGGGRLTLDLAEAELETPLAIAHDVVPPGRYVVLSMTDSGTGMDSETLGHIFEPFFTTKERGKGTGLGLATVYGIVRQTGGYIAVETAVGAGTTFRVYLPRCLESTTSGVRPAVAARHGTETVLVVEDESAVRALVAKVLERRGYSVLVAGNAMAALDVVTNDPRPIHLLLTDLVMPGMNGRELASRVRALRPSIKVIFMSGYAADAPPDFVAIGVGGFLPKPFSENALASKVREVLDAPPA